MLTPDTEIKQEARELTFEEKVKLAKEKKKADYARAKEEEKQRQFMRQPANIAQLTQLYEMFRGQAQQFDHLLRGITDEVEALVETLVDQNLIARDKLGAMRAKVLEMRQAAQKSAHDAQIAAQAQATNTGDSPKEQDTTPEQAAQTVEQVEQAAV